MIVNNGFLVKNDRYSLTEKNLYFLRGWLAPRTELTAFLDGKPFPAEVQKFTDNVDERYGGSETVVLFHLPENVAGLHKLKVYSAGDKGKRLSFEISAAELAEKQQDIRLFVDDYSVSEKDGLLRLQGWVCGLSPVEIRVADSGGKEIPCHIDRYNRLDVVDLFDEYAIDPKCGFNIEIRPVPKNRIRVFFKCGDREYERVYHTSPLEVKAGKAGHLLKKGNEYFRYNGFSALMQKTYDKMFNPAMKQVVYADWIKKHLPTDRALAREKARKFSPAPLFSIVVPLYKTPEPFLMQLISSVKAQSYAGWELILSDGSGDPSPLEKTLTKLAASDPRIRVLENRQQLHISENTNAALKEAKGDYIVFADHDDLLTPDALYENAMAIERHPEAELLYSDEDKIGVGEKYMQPNLKPDFDPDLLNSVNYICHLLVVRRDLLEKTGLLNPEYDGAQDYDFILRCTEKTKNIVHIPRILYHWRFFEGSTAANPESKTYAFTAGQRAIQAHYDRMGWPASVEMGEFPGIYRTHWNWDKTPSVTVMIPNKDHVSDLEKCLASIRKSKAYPDLEILIIENNSTEQETFSYYEKLKNEDSRVRIVYYKGSFNYSAINNFGAKEARGEYLFLLNNDTEFISEDVIGELLGFCLRPDVGAVGARLYYGDNTIQHAGVIVGWGGIAGHAFVNQKRGETGYMHRIICQQDLSAVTAACMMVKRSAFDKVGGFTEELAVAFNDIDFCMKIRKAGYLIVYNPYAELYHYESKSRGLENTPEKIQRFTRECDTFRKNWPEILRDGDPYYNPNLSMVTQDFSLKRN
ncbi:MAG TPA: glycosyltransferase family 2 protein [Lachnospiraceae bacterium]|nr:glycosyltransferase family 2 protein [Lachnospiraceae bacterium]